MSEVSFDPQTVGEVRIPSTWSKARAYQSREMQCMPPSEREVPTQTIASSVAVGSLPEKAVETDESGQTIPAAEISGTHYVYPGLHYSAGDVAAFLEGVVPSLTSQLVANTKGDAYDGYQPQWTEQSEAAVVTNLLAPSFLTTEEWHATALSWNAGGSTIAVGYGRIDDTSFPHRRGVVCVWNLRRSEIGDPDTTLDLQCPVTSLAFHPAQHVLAVGLYNGDIAVYDLGTSGPPQAAVGKGASREAIVSLSWLLQLHETQAANRFVLCSASNDGTMLYWQPADHYAQVRAAFDVHNRKRHLVGIQSMAFGRLATAEGKAIATTDSVVLLGTESGDVYRAKPILAIATGGKPTALDVDSFDAHGGPVHAVDTSPFFRHLFLTISSDGSLRLRSVLERHSLLIVEPSMDTKHFLYAAQFSPFRPTVIAVASRSSHLLIYDLQKSKLRATLSLDGGTDGSALLSLAFNAASPRLIATGDAKGVVKVWQLPTSLYQPTDAERAAMRGKRGKEQGDEADPADDESTIRSLFGFHL